VEWAGWEAWAEWTTWAATTSSAIDVDGDRLLQGEHSLPYEVDARFGLHVGSFRFGPCELNFFMTEHL